MSETRLNRMVSMADALFEVNPRLAQAYAELDPAQQVLESPVYDCPTCEDRGMVSYNVPFGHELFGKLMPCPDCQKGNDLQVRQWQIRLKNAALPEAYQQLTFASWDALPENLRAGKRLALFAATLFAATFDHYVSLAQAYRMAGRTWKADDVIRNSLVFQGPVGVGKTGLAAAIVNDLLARSQPALYVRVQDFIASVQERYGKSADEHPTDQEVIDAARRAPVLVLDEMNMVAATDNRREIMENVIRYRYGNALPTIVTCNHSQDELTADWGERTTNVLFAMAHWVPMGGLPIRIARPPVEAF